jgi:hypothetical protein
MFLPSVDRSEVPTPYEAVRLLLKCRFRVEFFDFRVSALCAYPVSGAGLLDFPQLLLKPRTGSPLRRSCKCCFSGTFLKMDTVSVQGSLQPRTSGALINFLTNGKYPAFEPRTGTG